MCGISGIVQSESGVLAGSLESNVKRINDAQSYRGPDDSGVWISTDQSVGLGHRRLSIVDLSPTGKQPMYSRSGRYVAVFNGEIYNFQEIRVELEGFGHIFVGTSDTEVMLTAVEHWGIQTAVSKFNGMFAVALWDIQERELSLFRDRLGVKPLYYQWHDGNLSFSSELTPEFASLGPKEIDRKSLALFFRYNCVPSTRSIYKNVFKLAPGVVATATCKSVAEGRFSSTFEYWNTSGRINEILDRRTFEPMSEKAGLELLDRGLTRSIRQRMISDVPLGAFLSGGIDSSLMVSYMAALSPSPVKTFTIGFSEAGFNEAESAKAIAKHLRTDHSEFYVTEKDALDVIPSLPRMYGEPFADSSQIPTFIVSRLTRQQVTVALSGDGGDELFAGYSYYQTIGKLNSLQKWIPQHGMVLGAKMLSMPGVRHLLERGLGAQNWGRVTKIARLLGQMEEPKMPQSFNGHLSQPEALVLGAPEAASLRLFDRCRGNFVEQAMCDDLMNYLPDDILVKVDRASMATSLEIRAPFVDDYELLELAWSLPYCLKRTPGRGGKLILKKLLSRHVPSELFERPKQGFGIPLVTWLNGPLRGWVDECVNEGRLRAEGFLNPEVVANLQQRTSAGSEGHAYTLWAVCMFQSWLRQVHSVARKCEA